MLTLLIWWLAIVLELLVLYRGFRCNLVSKYPFFYTYIVSVLFSDVGFYFVYGESYAKWKLVFTLLILFLGYGIILEIFRYVLSPYPGAERFARITGLIVFSVVFSFALIYPLVVPETLRGASMVDLPRDFKTVQAIFLFAVFCVVSYYRIPLGKNLKGMTLGYGLCLGVSLITLALRAYIGLSFDAVWVFLQPVAYDISLVIWVITLWAYHPNPIPDTTIRLETDYELFVSRTRETLGSMRSYLTKAARS